MGCYGKLLVIAVVMARGAASRGQNAEPLVQEAVQTELAADDADHSHWLYFDVYQKPGSSVKQWVAETSQGDEKRVVEEDGRKLSEQEQQSRIDSFVRDAMARTKQHKNNAHDDEQAREMLSMLPHAFIWTKVSDKDGRTVLHFAPDPNFHPPDYEARVFAAMEGDMTVDDTQHRIASLKGRMIHDVKFLGGLLGELQAGGSFEVERRELKPRVWQITETHVHIQGHALLFKSISDEEDESKDKFQQLTGNLSLAEGEQLLMKQKN